MKTAFRRSVEGLVAAATAAALALSFASQAQAVTATIDVQQLTFSGTQGIPIMAQTFTAGTTSELVRISLPFYTNWGLIRIGVQSVSSSGTPTGTYLTAQYWSGSQLCCRQFHDFDLSQPIAVTKGTQYAIVVSRISGFFNWYESSYVPSNFSGGQLYVSSCLSGCTWYTGGTFGADFGFKTWVGSAANQAPTVAADNSALNVSEGTAPANTGTYSDPDGDAVSLTASSGTVTKTGTSNGTWSWTAPASDESSATQTVTVTADDGQGQTAVATFTLSVYGVAPAAQILTDPATVPEGKSEPFTGAATTADPVDTTGLTYNWLVTKDGSSYAEGSGTAFNFTPNDEGTYVVNFSATDDGGMTGTTSMTIIGTNVAPTAAITGVTASAPLVITANEDLSFSGTFTDPGTLDTHTATWNFGDGGSSVTNYGPGGSASTPATHSYAKAGTYAVSLTVSDDDGGVGQATTTVTVQTTQQALSSIAAYVQQKLPLNGGQKQSLLAKLNAASASASRGDTTATNNQLNAFLNELNADVNSGKLTKAQAAPLWGAVHAIQGTLGTYNRFLDWLALVA